MTFSHACADRTFSRSLAVRARHYVTSRETPLESISCACQAHFTFSRPSREFTLLRSKERKGRGNRKEENTPTQRMRATTSTGPITHRLETILLGCQGLPALDVASARQQRSWHASRELGPCLGYLKYAQEVPDLPENFASSWSDRVRPPSASSLRPFSFFFVHLLTVEPLGNATLLRRKLTRFRTRLRVLPSVSS